MGSIPLKDVGLSMESTGMRLLHVLAVTVLAQGAAGAVFEIELWPGEGRPRFVAGGAAIQPRVDASIRAAAMRPVSVTPGQPIEFGKTVHRTTKAGRLRASVAATITGRRLGRVVHLSRDEYYSGTYSAVTVPVAADEMFEYLQYRAEGTCFVRIRGDVIDAHPCPLEARMAFVLEAEPETEWWVEYLASGQARGWLLVDGKDVRETARRF